MVSWLDTVTSWSLVINTWRTLSRKVNKHITKMLRLFWHLLLLLKRTCRQCSKIIQISRQNSGCRYRTWLAPAQLLLVVFYPVIVRGTYAMLQSRQMNNSTISVVCTVDRIFSQGGNWALFQYHHCPSPSGRYHCCKTSLAPLPIPQLPTFQPALSG